MATATGWCRGDRRNHFPADWSGRLATSAAPNAPTLQMATYKRGMLSPGVTTPPPSVQAPGEFWFSGQAYFRSSFVAPVVAGVLANWMVCEPGMPFLPFVDTPGQLPLLQSVARACP